MNLRKARGKSQWARRWTDAGGPPLRGNTMDLYCSAIAELNGHLVMSKKLQCRTVPAAWQTPCALGNVAASAAGNTRMNFLTPHRSFQ
jgi:hypothetical protein